MAFKFVALFALIAVAAAVPVEYHYHPAPVLVNKRYAAEPVYADAPAEYEFNYAINDEETGDVKSQQETRKGDHVVGQYSLIDADGYKRIVEYTADDRSGFKAVLHRQPISGYKPAAPVALKYISTPVAHYNHGTAHVAYSSPTNNYHY